MKKVILVILAVVVAIVLVRALLFRPAGSRPVLQHLLGIRHIPHNPKGPLSIGVTVQVRAGRVLFTPRIVDAEGAGCSPSILAEGAASPPKVIVRDEAGKVVHSAHMQYG